jgi:cell division protein FtsI/penicillin-binding protein 2
VVILKPNQTHEKVNNILNIILVLLLLILFRIWHLSIVQHDEFAERARKPQLRVLVESAERGTITDCFGVVLAGNKIQYNAGIYYNHFKQIPRVQVKKDSEGKKSRSYPRKEYISKLAYFLADELELDPLRVEDLIYSRAAVFPQLPFVLKENISEKTYYRLKFLEREWLGLYAEKKARRYYPQGKVGSSVIGYLGPISSSEYQNFHQRLKVFENYFAQEGEGAYLNLPKGVATPQEAIKKYEELKEKSYKLNDLIGKTGIEARFNQDLKGFRGKRTFISDAKGNYLRELPESRDAFPGKRIQLTLSYELQKLAEELLVKSEGLREGASKGLDVNAKVYSRFKQPYIKGGAIVVMDPKNGDVLALASYPRLDANLLMPNNSPEKARDHDREVLKNLENESYIGGIWDGKWPLEKEGYSLKKKEITHKTQSLSFDKYLELSLANGSPIPESLKEMTVNEAVSFQRAFFTLLTISEEKDGANFINNLYPEKENYLVYERFLKKNSPESLKEKIDKDPLFKTTFFNLHSYFSKIPDNYEKLLLLDFTRLVIDESLYSENLLKVLGQKKLSEVKNLHSNFSRLEQGLLVKLRASFEKVHFRIWREEQQVTFLKEKRKKEKESGGYARPYLDYLDAEQEEQFNKYWASQRTFYLAYLLNPSNKIIKEVSLTHKPLLEEINLYVLEIENDKELFEAYGELKSLLVNESSQDFSQILNSFQNFSSFKAPLVGRYFGLKASPGEQNLKHLAMAFYPTYGFGFSKSFAYQDTAVQGSIFKVITAYAALSKTYFKGVEAHPQMLRQLNPFEITDNWHWEKKGNKKELIIGYFSDGKKIPRMYKGGRIPKSQRRNIGKIDLIKAIESSSNPYFALLSSEILEEDDALLDYSKLFGFGEKSGIDLPCEHPGFLPKDLLTNKNGIYSLSMGQHTLEVTPLQTAVMLSSLANGGAILKPRVVKKAWGNQLSLNHRKLFSKQDYSYKDFYDFLGLDFPLFTVPEERYEEDKEERSKVEVRSWIFMPSGIQSILSEGMRKVVSGSHGCARREVIRGYQAFPEIVKNYDSIRPQLMGKTSTSEASERLDMARKCNIYNHIWFGGVSFNKNIPQLDNLVRDGKPFVFHDKYGDPELCVVVYLKFGDYGREAAPIAGEIIKKWRGIKEANQS